MQFLLLQVRNPDDPMRLQEVACFSRALGVPRETIAVLDLLTEPLESWHLEGNDLFLLGGSGDYSAASPPGTHWLERALASLRTLHASGKPVFASCWGFQAIARAMGGTVINDRERAELGTIELRLTDAGRDDPIFGPLGDNFAGHAGHEDRVATLPPHTTLLASSDRCIHQAFRFDDAPIYCTQFHPELNRGDLLQRVRQYPRYAEEVAGITLEQFEALIRDTPETEHLLRRFADWVRTRRA
jgi:GMP synthase (glutamine-hydrolysing)